MHSEPFVIDIKGFDQVMGNLRNLYEKAPAEFGQAAREEMDTVMIESKRECPYDIDNPHDDGTPHMRDTGLVEGPIIEEDGVAVLLSYDVPYAAIQHETPEYRHRYPEKWKFLEDPMNRHIPRIAPVLIKRMELILQGAPAPDTFSSLVKVRQDYATWRGAFSQGQFSKYGHLLGRFG